METSYIINLAARYAAAFGAIAVSNALNKVVVFQDDNKYNIEVYDEVDTTFEAVEFQFDGKKILFNGMLMGDDSSIFAPPLMMDFAREKNLIVTDVSGGDAEVIERWGTRPWNIDIKGILIDTSGRQYPTEKIEELSRFFDYNNVVEVVGQQFYEKNIDSIYIKSINITPLEGFTDTVQFSLTASSIKEVTWTLLKPND
ncbi:DUF6046 domain-containing protein [Epilithonimonas mollis]|uniref:DUF6046 domain-containing protein n=1 Tax=Epilithonimonas mollis TaxID=216903 RepID=A0A1M6UKL3_9FLAO|nr:DUF6046 domain-containing protein [Epilithonimonas mollis]SHK69752.1 hypothetical protein SAMN05444371_3355 [Epilithonimonas mollis]